MDRAEYEKMYRTEKSYFWFVAKQRLVNRLVEIYGGDGPLRILDLGCGTGSNLESLGRHGEALGLDHSGVALECCRRRGLKGLMQGEAGRLPFGKGSFDLVTVLDLLEHIEDDLAAVAESLRVLTPGGMLLVTVPAYPFLWGSHDLAMGHLRRYDKSELKEMIECAGFEVLRLTHFMGILFPAFLPVRLWQKIFGDDTSTITYDLPGFLNRLLLMITDLESSIIERTDMPLGTTLAAVGRKP